MLAVVLVLVCLAEFLEQRVDGMLWANVFHGLDSANGEVCFLLLLVANEGFVFDGQLADCLDITVNDASLNSLRYVLAQVQGLQVSEIVNLRLVHACPGGVRVISELYGTALGGFLFMPPHIGQLLLLDHQVAHYLGHHVS